MDRQELIPYAGREQSFTKHFLLKSYLERLIMIAGQRYDHIAYVDAFAGPWKSARKDLGDTSFAQALEVMEECHETLARNFGRSISLRALFVERDTGAYARLKEFADQRSTSVVEIRAINEDFAESAESVARWIRAHEIAFVLVDPTGWKGVIAPRTLAPLLKRRNVELLINVMSNFISLATGHANQEQNLRELVGNAYPRLMLSGGPKDWMRSYLEHLKTFGPSGASRLRTAWFPVEFPSMEKVFYYLTYVTHHVKGMITFLEESDKALKHQKQVKHVVRQQKREANTGMRDMFGDSLQSADRSAVGAEWDARALWLARLPAAGAELRVTEEVIADMAEEAGCLISNLQSALRRLIDGGAVVNKDAKRLRPKMVVDYEEGEKIRRQK